MALKAIDTKKSKCDFIRGSAIKDFNPDSEMILAVKPFLVNGDFKASEIGFRLLKAIIAGADMMIVSSWGGGRYFPFNTIKTSQLHN